MTPADLPVFVDTGAWYALQDADDRWHEAALRFFDVRPRLITTNFVIDETITLLLRHLGHKAALVVGERLWAGELARIVRVSSADEQVAWDLFKRYDDKTFSFTDCTSFVVMERLGLQRAFSFDDHFSQTGQFIRVP
jgi:predicted nucleic acid-binding protein